jgi:hypothetical protein
MNIRTGRAKKQFVSVAGQKMAYVDVEMDSGNPRVFQDGIRVCRSLARRIGPCMGTVVNAAWGMKRTMRHAVLGATQVNAHRSDQ